MHKSLNENVSGSSAIVGRTALESPIGLPTIIVYNGDSCHARVSNTSAPMGVLENDVEINVGLVLVVIDDGDGDHLAILALGEYLDGCEHVRVWGERAEGG